MIFAMPKSSIRNRGPASPSTSMMFAGLMSRCTMPRRCAYATASITGRSSAVVSAAERPPAPSPRRRSSARSSVSPSSHSSAIQAADSPRRHGRDPVVVNVDDVRVLQLRDRARLGREPLLEAGARRIAETRAASSAPSAPPHDRARSGERGRRPRIRPPRPVVRRGNGRQRSCPRARTGQPARPSRPSYLQHEVHEELFFAAQQFLREAPALQVIDVAALDVLGGSVGAQDLHEIDRAVRRDLERGAELEGRTAIGFGDAFAELGRLLLSANAFNFCVSAPSSISGLSGRGAMSSASASRACWRWRCAGARRAGPAGGGGHATAGGQTGGGGAGAATTTSRRAYRNPAPAPAANTTTPSAIAARRAPLRRRAALAPDRRSQGGRSEGEGGIAIESG